MPMLGKNLTPVLIARLDARAEALPILIDVHGRGGRQQTRDRIRSLADDLRMRPVEPNLKDRATRAGLVEAAIAQIQPEDVGVGRGGEEGTIRRPSVAPWNQSPGDTGQRGTTLTPPSGGLV